MSSPLEKLPFSDEKRRGSGSVASDAKSCLKSLISSGTCAKFLFIDLISPSTSIVTGLSGDASRVRMVSCSTKASSAFAPSVASTPSTFTTRARILIC